MSASQKLIVETAASQKLIVEEDNQQFEEESQQLNEEDRQLIKDNLRAEDSRINAERDRHLEANKHFVEKVMSMLALIHTVNRWYPGTYKGEHTLKRAASVQQSDKEDAKKGKKEHIENLD